MPDRPDSDRPDPDPPEPVPPDVPDGERTPATRVELPRPRRLYAPATLAVTAGRPSHEPDGPLNQPVVLASTYHAGGPVAYGRDANPTWVAFEDAVGALEGGTALAYASGMAATAAVFEQVPVGGVVVVAASAYYGTRRLLESEPDRWELRPVDVADTDAALAACDGAQLLWLESPTNPMMDIADIPALASGAHERGAFIAVDNTFATPLGQRPLDHGADVVVHSVTKFLSGHSDLVMGATVSREPELCDALHRQRSWRGAIPGPMETFLALRGVRTLAVRYERAEASANTLAGRLAVHPAVTRVRYPGRPDDPGFERAERHMLGPGFMVSFEVRGGHDAAEAVAKATRLIVHATSLGGVETTIERRNRWPGEEATPPSLLRLSVGCEDVDDLWDDLARALRIACS